MSFQNDTPIVQKVYVFYKTINEAAKLFPREEKFNLGLRIKNTVLDILELLIEAGSSQKVDKYKILIRASVKLDLLKMLTHISYELKLISQEKHIQLEELLQEIGKMLGGWIRSNKNI